MRETAAKWDIGQGGCMRERKNDDQCWKKWVTGWCWNSASVCKYALYVVGLDV